MKTRKIGAILLIIAMVLTMMPLSAMAATATAIKFEKTSDMRAEQGKTYKREAITTPEGAAVTYSSSDKNIATVDKNGRVKAIAEGKAVITAKSGKVTASYTVVVSKAAADKTIKGVPANGYATIGKVAKAHPRNLYYQKVNSGAVFNGPWFPISAAKHKEYSEKGFSSKQELVSVMGTYYNEPKMRAMLKQNPNNGRWSLYWYDNYTRAYMPQGAIYYATIEEIIEQVPNSADYAFTEQGGWNKSSPNDGYAYDTKHTFTTKAEAQDYADSRMGHIYTSTLNNTLTSTHRVVATNVYQNPYTGKWFAGTKSEQIG